MLEKYDFLNSGFNSGDWKLKSIDKTRFFSNSPFHISDKHNPKVWCHADNMSTNRETLIYVDHGIYIMFTEPTGIDNEISVRTPDLLGYKNKELYQAMEFLKLLNTIFSASNKLDEEEKTELVNALEAIEHLDALAFSDDVSEDEHLKYSEQLHNRLENLLEKYDGLISNHRNSEFNWTASA